VSTQPEFPLLHLDDGLAAEKAFLSFYESSAELGICNRLGYLGGFYDRARLYSRDGIRYRVGSVHPEPRITWLGKVLARLGYDPLMRLEVRLVEDGPWELDFAKERIRALLAKDPGDLLFQWTTEEEWEKGLSAASTPTELFDFLTKKALVEHDDDSNATG
jgi:hypothetical protein